MSSLEQSLPSSVIKFLREQKIKKEQKEQQAREQAIQEAEKRREEQEIRDYLMSQKAPLINIKREWNNFLKNRDPKKLTLLQEIQQRPEFYVERHFLRRRPFVNQTPESITQKVLYQTELLSTLKREWEAKKAEEKALEEAVKEAERQRLIARNEQEKRNKEEETARLRVSLRPRVEKDVSRASIAAIVGGIGSYHIGTGNKIYDEMFSELIQPRIEQFKKEQSYKGVDEAYEYISRRQKNGIKHLGQWTGSELTQTEEEILERLKLAVQSGKDSRSVEKIFNEYVRVTNHSGGKRKTRRKYKYSYNGKRNTRYNK